MNLLKKLVKNTSLIQYERPPKDSVVKYKVIGLPEVKENGHKFFT